MVQNYVLKTEGNGTAREGENARLPAMTAMLIPGHINGNHRDSRSANLQALHGYCHDAKTREHGDYLPPGLRDKHQDTEERREAKVSCSVLEQR